MLILCNCVGSHTEKSNMFPKKQEESFTLENIKTFLFSNEYVKIFSVINYGFPLFYCQQTLNPVCKSYHRTSVSAIWKCTETIADSS